MNRKEFGKLIAALREEQLDFSAKGMGVWTQTKLAQEACLPEKTISQLEQGRKMNLDAWTLTQIARALKLTAGEQVELFAAAAGVDAELHRTLQNRAEATLHTMLQLIGEIRLPAYLHDAYANVLGGNTLALRLLQVPEQLLASAPTQASGFNLLRFVFAPESPYKRLLGGDWGSRAERNVRYFRAISLPCRHTPRFKTLLAELSGY